MTEKGRLVFDGAHVRAVHFGETDRISVMLDHGRPKRNGFPVQAPQRTMANMGIGTLSIMLSEASWFLTPENQALRAALDAHCSKARDVRAIGFSMGGFGAALLSKSLHLRKALLISPQYSIFPSRAPWDRRRNWISRNFKEEWDDLDQQIKSRSDRRDPVRSAHPVRHPAYAFIARPCAAAGPGCGALWRPSCNQRSDGRR